MKKPEPIVTFEIITDVATEVVTLAEAKAFMGIDFPDFDSLITTLITAAREEAENYTGLSIGERTIQLSGDFTDPKVYMPFAPYLEPNETGLQTVGYTPENIPAVIKLAILNMVHIAFDNRTTGLDFGTGLDLLARSRRRVGL